MDSLIPITTGNLPLPNLSSIASSSQSDVSDSVKAKNAKRAAVEFESVFVSQLLKEMRQTLEPGVLFGSDPGEIYGGLFDLFIGKHVAESGGSLGIARMVSNYLNTR